MAQQTVADATTGNETESGDPNAVADREAGDVDFSAALDELREGIDGYGDRISASAAVMRAVDDLSVPSGFISNPKIEQSVWRYDLDAEVVRGEIERAIERYRDEDDDPVNVGEIVAAFRVAAVRLDTPISTD